MTVIRLALYESVKVTAAHRQGCVALVLPLTMRCSNLGFILNKAGLTGICFIQRNPKGIGLIALSHRV